MEGSILQRGLVKVPFAGRNVAPHNGPVLVTAQFREQNVQDTPLAITAVSAEMLEARNQTNITEITNQAPNVTLKPQGATYGPSIAASIRGIGQLDFNPTLGTRTRSA